MVTINFENGKAVRATNGKFSVYNFGDALPEKYLTRIVNALGQEKCILDDILSIFTSFDFYIFGDSIGVFDGNKLIVVIE